MSTASKQFRWTLEIMLWFWYSFGKKRVKREVTRRMMHFGELGAFHCFFFQRCCVNGRPVSCRLKIHPSSSGQIPYYVNQIILWHFVLAVDVAVASFRTHPREVTTTASSYEPNVSEHVWLAEWLNDPIKKSRDFHDPDCASQEVKKKQQRFWAPISCSEFGCNSNGFDLTREFLFTTFSLAKLSTRFSFRGYNIMCISSS